jgi:hypothetical protein
VIAQTQTRRVLDRELTVGSNLAWFNFQIAAQRISQLIGPGECAYRRAAHAYDRSADRLPRKHLVKVDNAVNIGERHA